MYDAKSMKAEEFIDHNEIMETLEYAAANKNNAALISEIIEKAKLRKGSVSYTHLTLPTT